MTKPAPWKFGEDTTCLAKIHPGNAHIETPKKLTYRNGLEIRKVPDQEDPLQGWFRVNRDEAGILSQEVDAHTQARVIMFRPDPDAPSQVAFRRARKRAQAQGQVALARNQIKGLLKEVLLESGVIGVDPEADEVASPVAESTGEASSESIEEPEIGEELSLEETFGDEEEEQTAPEPALPPRTRRGKGKKKAAAKKKKGRLSLSEE